VGLDVAGLKSGALRQCRLNAIRIEIGRDILTDIALLAFMKERATPLINRIPRRQETTRFFRALCLSIQKSPRMHYAKYDDIIMASNLFR
jgi:hypothetical protein